MFVIKKLRLNKFQPRPIVSNRALSLSVGDRPASIISKETSDCIGAPSLDGANKNKVLSLAQQTAQKAYEHHKGEQTPELSKGQKDL